MIDAHRLEDYKEPYLVQLMYKNSDETRIITDGNVSHTPPVEIFGPEPEHTWCYYYQKMTLARQQSDWQTVAALADEALAQDFKPLNRAEWLPVFEAYANTGRLKDANQIAKIIRGDKDLQFILCQQDPPNYQNYNYDFIYSKLCENP